MIVRGMANAAPAWHITGTIMRGCPAVSFLRRPRLLMIEALRHYAVTRGLFKNRER